MSISVLIRLLGPVEPELVRKIRENIRGCADYIYNEQSELLDRRLEKNETRDTKLSDA